MGEELPKEQQAQLISFYELDGLEMAEATRLALDHFDQLTPEEQRTWRQLFQVELSSGKRTEVPYLFKAKVEFPEPQDAQESPLQQIAREETAWPKSEDLHLPDWAETEVPEE